MTKKIMINLILIIGIGFSFACEKKTTESEKPLSAFEKGMKYYDDGQYLEAEKKLMYIPADDSNYSDAVYYLKLCRNNSHYEKGLKHFNNNRYLAARNEFGNITPEDSNYSAVQDYIKICDERGDVQLKKQKQLQQKYDRIFGGSGWLHEKQSKLMDLGFRQDNSGYEEAPDGSKQLAMYYKKDEDEYTINVRLQYSYSMDYHYAKVWVEIE